MAFPEPVIVPSTLIPVLQKAVCPHCHALVEVHRFFTGAFLNSTYHCRQHGDVSPRWSALYTPDQRISA
ncbi:MAG: hypothetical protein H6974_11140 [Gammaproteobacteria bacterium]|nr:hypothetical protein [Gammaproteobacteria bacterium]